MGLLGSNTRRWEGIEYEFSADFDSRQEAEHWQKEAQSYGFSGRIIPNAAKQRYELWVSLLPVRRDAPKPAENKESV